MNNYKSTLSFTLLFTFLISTFTLSAQYRDLSSSYIGAMFGVESAKGPAWDQGGYTQGTFEEKGKPLAMTFQLCNSSGKKGLHLGYYLAGTIGGVKSKFMRDDLGGGLTHQNGVWTEEFDIIADFRLGLALNYELPKQNMMATFRYFNWYNAGGVRAYYDNSDDAAALALGLSWKYFSAVYSYASDKIPGVLVNSDAWTYQQIEFRARAKEWKEDKMVMSLGLRFENSRLNINHNPQVKPDSKVMMICGLVTFGFN